MRKTAAALLGLYFTCVSSGMPVKPGQENRGKFHFNTALRVLLRSRVPSISIRWNHSPFYLTGDRRSLWLPGNGRIRIERYRARGEFRLAVSLQGRQRLWATQIALVPAVPSQALFQIDNRQYRGTLQVTTDELGLVIVNQVPLEEYLAGILPAEMSPSWEAEALEAQAIAARSYALYRTLSPRGRQFDVENGTRDQVYLGFDAETAATDAAVTKTKGLFLSENGLPIAAYFHSRCGGTTETSRSVWNTDSPAGSHRIPCPFCRLKPYFWSSNWDRHVFLQALHLADSPLAPMTISVLGKSPSGRITELRVASADQSKSYTSDQFRKLLGYDQIKSALFQYRVDGNSIHFEGIGFGHGVGMCQWGARQLARLGRNFRQILSYYYPGVDLTTSNEDFGTNLLSLRKGWN